MANRGSSASLKAWNRSENVPYRMNLSLSEKLTFLSNELRFVHNRQFVQMVDAHVVQEIIRRHIEIGTANDFLLAIFPNQLKG